MAANPAVAASRRQPADRWSSHRAQALAVRAVVYVGPIVASIVFIHYAGKVIPAPLSSLWLYLAWWFGLSIAATVVLIAIDRVTRRLLPLAALLQLSLVFPDEAPSRFKVAFKAGDVRRLEERLGGPKAADGPETPSEAAARLLELVAALNIHDPLTRGHCDRVRAYSVMIGEELGLSREDLDLLNWAALLHDVGKLEVPTEILAKDGRPTDEEWQALRQHPLFGESLVEPMRAWLGTWTSAVGFHHERWDGKGYPRGLEGEDIPLPGRIVAVADVFDVITSVRSYKQASAAEEGRMEIARCAGTQFDPAVVRAFLNVSLGRMRLVMGPLSWLAHAPLLGRMPFTPALGTAASVLGVAATSAAAGIVGPAAPRPAAAVAAPPAHVAVHHAPQPAAHRHPRIVVRLRHTPAPRTPSPAPSDPPVASTPPPPPTAPTPAPAPAPGPDPTPAPAPAPPPAPPAHRPPSFTAAPDPTVLEDSGPASLVWAREIQPGDQGTSVRFLASTDASGLFAVQPSVSADGVLHFTPARDAYGVADVAVTAVDDANATASRTLHITIAPVNDAPTFTPGGDVVALEDDGSYAAAWATAVSPGPPNESRQHVGFTVTTDAPGLFAPSGQPLVDDSGLLTFTPAFLATGTATVTVTAVDDGGTANDGVDRTTQTLHIVILPRNHAPTLTGVGDVSALEDAGPQSVQWVTATGPGAPNESGQSVTLSLTSDQPGLFAVQPSLSPTGLLTYTPAANAFGTATATVTAHDDGGTANGGHDTTTATFAISIAPVNDAPTFTSAGNVSVLENAGPQSIAWASAILPGPPNESAQSVSFSTSDDDPSLFAAGGEPAVAPDGTLTFTPAFAASGTANVTVTAHDDGGTANGGHDTATSTFQLTITAVNQAPSFTGAGDVTSAEDGGAQSLQWATSISPGPNEPSQTVSFSLATTNPGLFSAAPAISPTGLLTYTAAPNANGAATVTVTAQDDGGTANGGHDTATATFTLTVTPVNDAPTFTGAGNQTVLEDAGAQSVAWASAISPGPADEAGQSVSFSTSSTNPALFAAAPSISGAGVLTYTPAANANGSATVTVTAQDDGGTASGGQDSTTTTFTITVTPVNDAPAFVSGGDRTVLEDSGAQSGAWATGISPGPADEAAQHVTFGLTNDDNALFAAQPAVDAAGTLTYTPAANANGTATVTVTAQDDGGTANGGHDTTTATFTITVTPVNDAPTIAPPAAQSANEDDGPQVVALTAFTPGPANEASQTVSVSTSVDHPEYFDVAGQPTIDAAGTLSYTPATGKYGTAVVTVTASDDGGTTNGGVDTTSTTFTITLAPLPPNAGDDAYATTVLNLLTVDAAHGVLANDADVNSSTMTVTPQTTSSGPLGGTLTLAADGSFTYQAGAVPGQDSFTYTVTDGLGQTATGTITIDVALVPPTGGTLYLQTSGLSADVWGLGATAPAAVAPVPDLDADGHPGLTIAGGDGKITITETKKQKAWAYETGASTLPLHGPLTLNLTAASANFDTGKAETLWVYVYDCPGGSSLLSTASCTLIGQNKVLVSKWNLTAAYATHSAVVSLDTTLAAGRQLRVRLLVGGASLWIPLVSPYESSIDYTG